MVLEARVRELNSCLNRRNARIARRYVPTLSSFGTVYPISQILACRPTLVQS